jgi:hypothetical protein
VLPLCWINSSSAVNQSDLKGYTSVGFSDFGRHRDEFILGIKFLKKIWTI